MNNEQILGQLSKREVAFRMSAGCLYCACWKPDKYKHWRCTLPNVEEACRERFERLMREEADE